jgi:hypothetical protein
MGTVDIAWVLWGEYFTLLMVRLSVLPVTASFLRYDLDFL